jgi:threonine dehydratase
MSWSDLQPATSFKTMGSSKSGSFKVAADTAAAAAAAGDAAECVNSNGVVLEQGPTCLPPADPANTVQGKCTASRREWLQQLLAYMRC